MKHEFDLSDKDALNFLINQTSATCVPRPAPRLPGACVHDKFNSPLVVASTGISNSTGCNSFLMRRMNFDFFICDQTNWNLLRCAGIGDADFIIALFYRVLCSAFAMAYRNTIRQYPTTTFVRRAESLRPSTQIHRGVR